MNPILGGISLFISLFMLLPLWFYLIYSILVRVDASGIMWMAFAAYIVVKTLGTILVGTGQALSED